MKALVLQKKNAPVSLKEAPDPLLKADMVLLRIQAAALNHRDIWIQAGKYAGLKYPVIPGSDGCGLVEELGKDVPKDWLGKRVIVNPSIRWGSNEACQGKEFEILGMPKNGTFAELMTAHVKHIHPAPEHLTAVQAAALPLAGLTAYRALISRAHTRGGDKVLVTGIGGGVALFAMQYALALGCEVWVTSGHDRKLKAAQGLGAAGGVNYKEADWHTVLKERGGKFDVIIDGAGGPGFARLVELAAEGGRIALYGGTAGNWESVSPQRVFWKQLSILGSTMGSPSDFHNMLRFVNDHKIVPVVDEVFPFASAKEAVAKMKEGDQFGKLVLDLSTV